MQHPRYRHIPRRQTNCFSVLSGEGIKPNPIPERFELYKDQEGELVDLRELRNAFWCNALDNALLRLGGNGWRFAAIGSRSFPAAKPDSA